VLAAWTILVLLATAEEFFAKRFGAQKTDTVKAVTTNSNF
jgi:hypothetical protein